MRSSRQKSSGDDELDLLDPDNGSVWETRAFQKVKGAANMITEKTSLPFRLIVPIAALIIASTWKISGSINKIERGLSASWTISQMDAWTRQLRRDNPTIVVPDAREIFETKPPNSRVFE
jgi:hypothetical protein